ncbi:MAG: metallophosphoesterase [Bacteriovoracaceae bacterium]|nr:metallophosphoesterase [Bacteriovoracaceae bacterium]
MEKKDSARTIEAMSPSLQSLEKIFLVISDLHLGAGDIVRGRKNYLEDFHSDRELIDFLDYYSQGKYEEQNIELVINGDFLDFLAVPYVDYFDDEFWSEKACVEKLELILSAHAEVFKALERFLNVPHKVITYIIGNHDAELILPKVRDVFLQQFSEKNRDKFKILYGVEEYNPVSGLLIKHGHQYEKAHNFDQKKNIIYSLDGEAYFLPPWGSYYVTRVINKFKRERSYINSVRPIKAFLIYGLIFDFFFTLRFMFANLSYFFMVRFMYVFKITHGVKTILKQVLKEMHVFPKIEVSVSAQFEDRPDIDILVVGHTHLPEYLTYEKGNVFINTGTWTRMIHMDFARLHQGFSLTYAEIHQLKGEQTEKKLHSFLRTWKGISVLPYKELG